MHRPRPRHVLLASAFAAAAVALATPVGMTVVDRMTAEPLPADFYGPTATLTDVHGNPAAASRSIVRDPVGATPTTFDDLPGAPGIPGAATPAGAPSTTTDPTGTPGTPGTPGAGPTTTTPAAPSTTSSPTTSAPETSAPGTSEPADSPAPTTPAAPKPEPSRDPTTPAPTSAPTKAPAPKPEPTPEPEPTSAPPTTSSPRTYPGASTTGVPRGTKLTRHDGDLTITKDGTVVDALDVRGLVKIYADDVTIKRSIIRGRVVTQQSYLVQISEDASGTKIVDTEIYAAHPTHLIKGVVGSNLTMLRTDVHDVIDQLSATGGGIRVEDSWFHDNLHYASDPLHGGGPSHDDNIQISHGKGFRIVGNRFEGAKSASVMIVQNSNRVSDVRITGNLIDGGACSINVAEGGHGAIAGVDVVDNTFGTATKHPHCAVISPRSTSVTHSGNTFTDGFQFGITDGA